MTKMEFGMTDHLPELTKSFVIQKRHSVIARVRYNTIISSSLRTIKYLYFKTIVMKHFTAFLILTITAIQLIAQDTTKTADTSRKFNQQLSEVTVTARRPLMVQEIDKTVVDVKNFISGAALNTIELLERIPGVTVNG